MKYDYAKTKKMMLNEHLLSTPMGSHGFAREFFAAYRKFTVGNTFIRVFISIKIRKEIRVTYDKNYKRKKRNRI